MNDVFEAIFGMLGLLIAFVEYDDYFSAKYPADEVLAHLADLECVKNGFIATPTDYTCRYQESSLGTILRCMVSALTALMGIIPSINFEYSYFCLPPLSSNIYPD